MSTAVEAQYPAEDTYAEDDFEDDFESEGTSSAESTPRRAAPAKPRSTASSLSTSASPHSSKRSSSAVAAPTGARTADQSLSFASNAVAAPERHAEEVVSYRTSATSSRSLHTTTSISSSSSTPPSSFSESHHSSYNEGHASSHHPDAESHRETGDEDNSTELEESGSHRHQHSNDSIENDVAAYSNESKEDNEHANHNRLNADAIGDGVERRADGEPTETAADAARTGSRDSGLTKRGTDGTSSRGVAARVRRGDHEGGNTTVSSAASNQNNKYNAAASEQHRVRRPEVPQNAEELEAMQAENARLRDVLFEKNRNQYHATLLHNTKSGHGMSSTGVATANNVGGGGAADGSHRDALAARLVQESLMAHRTLQALRLEQRDLTQRRDELKKLISQYKRASKYRELVEGVKQDILDYQEEYRDVQLEVRCNEKLLLLAEHMAESGVGDRRVQEEIRAQNALTQRRREHALRDADAAQRKHDAAAQRVQELEAEVERRREAAGNNKGNNCKSASLLAENRAKKDRIRELRAQLEEAEAEGQTLAASSQQRYRSQQSVRDDAEREYLQARISEMQRELAAIAERNKNSNISANDVSTALASRRNSTNTSTTKVGERAAAQELSTSLHQQQLRHTPSPPPTPSSDHGSLKATSPPPLYAFAEEEEAARPLAAETTHEIDVTAWLNAHPVAAVTNPVETLRPTSALSTGQNAELGSADNVQKNDNNSNEHSVMVHPTSINEEQNVYIPPVPQPPYAQEPVFESVPIPAAHSADAAPAHAEDDTPAWLGGGMDGAPAATDESVAPPGHDNSGYPVEGNGGELFEEEEVVDDDIDDEVEELDGPAPQHPAATVEVPKEDDGPDWLNF